MLCYSPCAMFSWWYPRTVSTVNPSVTNLLPHPYHLDESTLIFRGKRAIFSIFISFSIKFM